MKRKDFAVLYLPSSFGMIRFRTKVNLRGDNSRALNKTGGKV